MRVDTNHNSNHRAVIDQTFDIDTQEWQGTLTTCYRHIEENVRRHMTDSGIVTSEREKVLALLIACLSTDTTNNSIAGSEALCTLTEYISITYQDLVTYFQSQVLKKIEHNLQVRNIKYSSTVFLFTKLFN